MNILLINFSYRVKGNTSIVLRTYSEELIQNGFTVETLNISQKKIEMCNGCRICFDKGEQNCPHKDDIQEISRKIEENKLVIFGSPIYVEDINGMFKNWIDRMAYNCHRPAFYNNKAYIITTSGVGSSKHGMKTISRALQTWGFKVIGNRRYITGAKIEETLFKEEYEKIVKHEVKNIIKKMKRKNKPSFISLLYYKVQQKFYIESKNKETYDYRFWKNKGWLERKSNYFTNKTENKMKAFFAGLMGNIIAKVMLK